ncbi:MAG: DUF1292 domain-containing protein [Phascolarctobacterium sp.]|nr:DUF1292 domain-containing protein [Phascolarctobacterium sp.]
MGKDFSDPEIQAMMEDEINNIVVISDEEGNESYFFEEMVIPVGNKNYAILSCIDNESCDCVDGECDEDSVVIARLEFDENGEPVYLDPTDKEFEEVKETYGKLFNEWDEN